MKLFLKCQECKFDFVIVLLLIRNIIEINRIAAVALNDIGQLRSSGVGFSGVLFCYAIIEANHTTEVSRSFYGMFNVPAKLMPFLLLVVLQVFIPKFFCSTPLWSVNVYRKYLSICARVTSTKSFKMNTIRLMESSLLFSSLFSSLSICHGCN